MSFREAVEFFREYGGLIGTIEELIKEWPRVTCSQLSNAASHALDIRHCSKQKVDEAILALMWRNPNE